MRATGADILAVLVVGGFGPAAAAQDGPEAARTCAGNAVTISWDDPGVGATITGTSGPDVIQGGSGAETIDAGGGEDVVCGGEGADRIDGGSGRDELLGQGDGDIFHGPGLAEDVLTGGSRSLDQADYSEMAVGVRVDEATGLVLATGAGASGGILGVELVKGTSHDDHLVGTAADDILSGGGGDDVIDGRRGDDQLTGSGGRDTVTYARADGSVRLSFATEVAVVGAGAATDTLSGFEVAVGSRFEDRLIGGPGNDELTGGTPSTS